LGGKKIVILKYPLFLVEGGDVSLYYSVGDLEIHLEYWYVEEECGNAYDREGRTISLAVRNPEDGPLALVRFCGIEREPTHTSQLREGLILSMKYCVDEDWLSRAKLNELVELKIKKYQESSKREGLFKKITKWLMKDKEKSILF